MAGLMRYYKSRKEKIMARNRYDMDEILEDSFDISQLKRLAGYVSPYKKKMAGTIILMLSASALTMMVPIFFQRIMDYYIPQKDMGKVAAASLLTLAVACYSAIAMRFKIKTMSAVGQNIIHAIRTDIFNHLQELPFSYYDDKPHGKIQVRVVNYVNSLSDLLSNGIVNTVTDLCNLFFIIIFMMTQIPGRTPRRNARSAAAILRRSHLRKRIKSCTNMWRSRGARTSFLACRWKRNLAKRCGNG